MSSRSSPKRRRSININMGTYRALKIRAQIAGNSHTGIARAIWKGELTPLSSQIGLETGVKSVSMREALWLALKAYAADISPDESYAAIADQILRGKVRCPERKYFELGERLASQREEERKVESSQPHKDVDEANGEIAQKRPPKVNGTKSAKAKPRIKSEPSAEEMVKQLREEEEKRTKSRARLYRGEPIDQIDKRPSDKVEPDQPFYGGVKYL